MFRKLSLAVLAMGACMHAGAAPDRFADRSFNRTDLQLAEPVQLQAPAELLGRLHPALHGRSGDQQVVVRLTLPAAAKVADDRRGSRRMHRDDVLRQQEAFISRVQSQLPGARVVARTQLVLNAVFFEVDAADLAAIAADSAVLRIAPVGNYDMELSTSVPQIGAAAVQAFGVDGSGVTIAVIDSGVDYTHASFGGAGTVDAYVAAYGTDTGPNEGDEAHAVLDDQFPNAKVVAGFDFVGEDWPFGPLAPDPDPIPSRDDISFGGHGSHVAAIAAGLNGVAPGAQIVAIKSCASYSSRCNGVALIQGMEYAVDPNGDGDPRDRVDIVNMSLGANYGQPFDDDLSAAVDAATALGVLTVAAAGNGFDIPFITGSPAAAPTALSVAQTSLATSNTVQLMTITNPPAGDALAVQQTWSPALDGTISGAVTYGDGAGGNLDGCASFAPGSLSGQIVLIDRGACFFSLKAQNVQAAGGVLAIIGLVTPGDPFPGGFGGGPEVVIPTFMITQADANILRAGGAEVTFDPANTLAYPGLMVASSSRGPGFQGTTLKPEIGAPGASVSAASGSGDGTGGFGGTSGASPMVAGAAALIVQSMRGDDDDDDDDDGDQDFDPLAVKALLMSTGETAVFDGFVNLAPISRIGGGEVRVDQAAMSPVVVMDRDAPQAGLGFGLEDVADDSITLTRKLVLENTGSRKVRYRTSAHFRFADDEASGAVSLNVTPRVVTLPKGKRKTVKVRVTITGANLGGNLLGNIFTGGDPAQLTGMEFDGYVRFEPLRGTSQALQVPWHVLPRAAARVELERDRLAHEGAFVDTVGVSNSGVGTAQLDAYALLAVSEDIPEGARGEQSPTPDIKAFGVNTFCNDPACSDYTLAFAFSLHERQALPTLPGNPTVDIDIDRDGFPDVSVFNVRLNQLGLTGNAAVVFVVDNRTNFGSLAYFAEHAGSTGNFVYLVDKSQLDTTASGGPPAPEIFQNVIATVSAQDFYFGGPADVLPPLEFAPLGERYLAFPSGDLAAGESGSIDVLDFGPLGTNPGELGIMLLGNGFRGLAAHGAATEDTEVLFLAAPDADLSALDPPAKPGKGKDRDDDDDDD